MRIGRCAICHRELKLGEPRIRVILKDGREVNKTYCVRCFDKLEARRRVNLKTGK